MNHFFKNNWTQEDAPGRMELVFAYRFKEYGAFQLRKQYARNKLWAMGIVGIIIGMLSVLTLVGFQKNPEIPGNAANKRVCKYPLSVDTFQIELPQVETSQNLPSSGTEGSHQIPTFDPAAPDRPFKSGMNGDAVNMGDENGRGHMWEWGADSGNLPGNKVGKVDTQVYEFPESEAVFPPNEDAFRQYVQDNVVLPLESMESGLDGFARVRFMVNRNGSISHVRIVESNSSSPDFGKEVIRVIQQSPRWIPAMMHGKTVHSWREIPVRLVF